MTYLRTGVLVMAIVGAAALTGCSPTTAVRSSTPAPPSPASSAAPSPSPGPPTASPQASPLVFDEPTGFAMPSGNIHCEVYRHDARCDVTKHSYPLPAPPPRCGLEWASTLVVEDGSKGSFGCVGDPVMPSSLTLRYGDAIRVGEISCRSARDGVRCEDLATHHGFLLSRVAYQLF